MAEQLDAIPRDSNLHTLNFAEFDSLTNTTQAYNVTNNQLIKINWDPNNKYITVGGLFNSKTYLAQKNLR